MVFFRTRRLVVAIALVLALGLVPSLAPVAPASAFPFFSAGALHAPAGLWLRAWSLVTERWTKEGGGIDPDGAPTEVGSSTHPTKAGDSIDPNSVATKEGGGISPDG